MQDDDVRKAYKKLALAHHPDKAHAALPTPRPSLTGAFAAAAAAASGRARVAADDAFKRITEAREAVSDERGRTVTRGALAREAWLFSSAPAAPAPRGASCLYLKLNRRTLSALTRYCCAPILHEVVVVVLVR